MILSHMLREPKTQVCTLAKVRSRRETPKRQVCSQAKEWKRDGRSKRETPKRQVCSQAKEW